MKIFAKWFLLIVLRSIVFGCATGDLDKRLPPPDAFNPNFLKYQALQGEKVMVVAVDLGGNWAFGYDHNRNSLQEAAESAAIRCDKQREKHKVFTKVKLFAVNDEIVYYDNQFK